MCPMWRTPWTPIITVPKWAKISPNVLITDGRQAAGRHGPTTTSFACVVSERERWTLLEFGARAAACLHNLVRLIFATPIQSTCRWVLPPMLSGSLPCFPATNLLLTPVPLFTNLGPTSFATRWWLSSVALPNLLRIWKILDYKPCFANLLSSLPSNWRLWRWCMFFCQIIKI